MLRVCAVLTPSDAQPCRPPINTSVARGRNDLRMRDSEVGEIGALRSDVPPGRLNLTRPAVWPFPIWRCRSDCAMRSFPIDHRPVKQNKHESVRPERSAYHGLAKLDPSQKGPSMALRQERDGACARLVYIARPARPT
jgi:hypothetical protein